MERYKFGKSVVIKHTLIFLLCSLIVSAFLLMCVSVSLFYCSSVEILSAISISLGASVMYLIIAFARFDKKSFSITAEELLFYYGDKVVKSYDLTKAVGTEIFKSILYRPNRKIYINTHSERIKFTVSSATYEKIKGFLPLYFKSKAGLVEFDKKYVFKSLLQKLCVMIAFMAVILAVFSPVVLGVVKNIPKKVPPTHLKIQSFYEQAKKYYFVALSCVYGLAFIGYTLYFLIKAFIFKSFKIRVDEFFEAEWFNFSLQKKKLDKSLIVGLRRTKSILHFLFNMEDMSVIIKDGDVVKYLTLPFAIKTEDADKVEVALMGEGSLAKQCKNSKACYAYAVFPSILVFALLIFSSILFSWWIMLLAIVPLLYFLFYFKNRSYLVAEDAVCLCCGVISQKKYVIKNKEIKGVTASKRFFEKKAHFCAYEVLIFGYNGIIPLGVYDEVLLEKIKEKF